MDTHRGEESQRQRRDRGIGSERWKPRDTEREQQPQNVSPVPSCQSAVSQTYCVLSPGTAKPSVVRDVGRTEVPSSLTQLWVPGRGGGRVSGTQEVRGS